MRRKLDPMTFTTCIDCMPLPADHGVTTSRRAARHQPRQRSEIEERSRLPGYAAAAPNASRQFLAGFVHCIGEITRESSSRSMIATLRLVATAACFPTVQIAQ